MTTEKKERMYGGYGPVDPKDYTPAMNYSGFFLDPYYWYLRLPNFKAMLADLKETPGGYGPWDILQYMTGSVSLYKKIPPRDKPIDTRPEGATRDWLASNYQFDLAYFPNRTCETVFKRKFLEPVFWNPWTDVSSIFTTSVYSPCVTFEKRALDCLEYYGLKKGQVICNDYYDDFIECYQQPVQNLRMFAMEHEKRKRWFEYMRGQRDYDTVFKPLPKPHTFKAPTVDPRFYGI